MQTQWRKTFPLLLLCCLFLNPLSTHAAPTYSQPTFTAPISTPDLNNSVDGRTRAIQFPIGTGMSGILNTAYAYTSFEVNDAQPKAIWHSEVLVLCYIDAGYINRCAGADSGIFSDETIITSGTGVVGYTFASSTSPYTLHPSDYYAINIGNFCVSDCSHIGFPPFSAATTTFWGANTPDLCMSNGIACTKAGSTISVPLYAGSPAFILNTVGTDERLHIASSTPVCTINCNDNVLFLPGIEASRLYRPQVVGETEQKLWEPGVHDDLHDLYLTPEGKSVRDDVYAKTGDVIDETPVGANIYKSFIAKMDDLKIGGKIADWESAPYDWRLSLDDILTHGAQTGTQISYLNATDTPYIIQELKRLAATSRTGKVTIVAHSNGGLVAKRLTELLGADANALIDKMIFVASPQAGTPAALAALLHGHDQAIAHGIVVDEAAARTFASASPMTYQLLPSDRYFTQVDDPVISFDTSLPDWIARYGSTIHSRERLHAFLVDSYGRVDAKTGNIGQPIQGNVTLLSNAETLHDDLDAWTPPPGVRLIQIAGWGVPTTVSGIEYASTTKSIFCSGICPHGFGVTASTTIDGDGTVVVPSALWTSTTTGAMNYWMNLNNYNREHPIQSGFGLKSLAFEHSRILETDAVLNFLSDQLASTTKPLADYTYLSTEAPVSTDSRLRYTLHSPLTLNLYDDLGRHTGVSTTTGEVEKQIPGTYYTQFGEVKYIFTDASTTAHIAMQGYAPGTFTFNVDEYAGDMHTASTTFRDIPTTASTTVMLDVQSDISTLSPMQIDKNGDGTIDATLTPKLNGIVTLDTTPPELIITFATSTNALAFLGTDDMGTTTVTVTTTYPALKKKEKEPHGIATTTVTARDEAGNTTVLVYTEKLPSPNQRDTITLQEIIYNGATTTIASTTVSYKWRQHKDGSYKLFASHLQTFATSTESHYRPNKNITVLMPKPRDLDDDESDDDTDIRPTKLTLPGMVVPYVRTEEGRMIIGY